MFDGDDDDDDVADFGFMFETSVDMNLGWWWCCRLLVHVWELTTQKPGMIMLDDDDDDVADFRFMFESSPHRNLGWCLMMMMMMVLQTLGSCLRARHTETWDDNALWWWWCCRLWVHVWELTTQKPGMLMLYDDDGVADFGFMFESSPHRNLGW